VDDISKHKKSFVENFLDFGKDAEIVFVSKSAGRPGSQARCRFMSRRGVGQKATWQLFVASPI
jgi:hypothetical protein